MSLANVENFNLTLPRVLGLLFGELGTAVKNFKLDQNSVGAQLTINFYGAQRPRSRRQRRRGVTSGKRTSPSASSARPSTNSVERLPASLVTEAPGPVARPASVTEEEPSDPSASPAVPVETQQTSPPVTTAPKRRKIEQPRLSPVKEPSSPSEMVVGCPTPDSPPTTPWKLVTQLSPKYKYYAFQTTDFETLPY